MPDDLVPVDQQPEFDHTLVPVDHDPFADPTGMLAPAYAMLASQNLRDPAVFDPKTYAPSPAMPTQFNVDPMSDTYAAAAPAVMAGVKGMAKGLGEMVATPARYAAPNPYPPGSEEASWYEDQREKMATEWAPETAMTLAGMGAPAAEAGAAGIFGGKLSKLADHAAIAKAEQMEAAGADASSIWKETKTARGADGQWRQEIDDSAAKLKMQPSELNYFKDTFLPDVLDHPELYEAYPHLRDVQVKPIVREGANGTYSSSKNTIEMNKKLSPEEFRSTSLHEVQHAVQNKEGFAPGDSSSAHIPPALGPAQKNFEAVRADTQAEIAKTYNTNPIGVEYMKDLIRRDKYGAEAAKQNISKPFEDAFRGILNRNPDVARRLGNIVDSEKLIDDAHAAAYEKYRAAMGEVESRSVQDRMKMSAAERAGIHPIYNEEIPRSQQRDPRLSGASADAPAASAEPTANRASDAITALSNREALMPEVAIRSRTGRPMYREPLSISPGGMIAPDAEIQGLTGAGELHILHDANGQIRGLYGSREAAHAAREARMREIWNEHGRTYGDEFDGAPPAVWNKTIAEWNRSVPKDRRIDPDDAGYINSQSGKQWTGGLENEPELQRRLEAADQEWGDKKLPYPGARRAARHFEEQGTDEDDMALALSIRKGTGARLVPVDHDPFAGDPHG